MTKISRLEIQQKLSLTIRRLSQISRKPSNPVNMASIKTSPMYRTALSYENSSLDITAFLHPLSTLLNILGIITKSGKDHRQDYPNKDVYKKDVYIRGSSWRCKYFLLVNIF